MTRAVIINELDQSQEMSGREFARALGLRTRAELDAAYDARVEWYIERILSGCTFSEYGNPAVAEAKKRIALREAAECGPDPLRHVEPKSRRAA